MSRDLFAENAINSEDLIQSDFIVEGKNIKDQVSTIPGAYIECR